MGSLLAPLAPLATTGVGSLPFTRPGEAGRHAVTAYELPFCPQLPHAYGDMVQEWLGADPGRCGWAPDRDRQLPAAWDAFILELSRRPPSHGIAKLQVTGPLTLAMALGQTTSTQPDDRPGLAHEVGVWLAAAVGEQVRGLAELGITALVMVDEPGLAATAGTAPAAASASVTVWDAIRAASPLWGLHVCGTVPWALLDAAEPDVISYDLARSGCDRAARDVLRRLIDRGGRIMWGVIDPAAPGAAKPAARAVGAAANAVAAGDTAREVLEASLLSPACGTGAATVAAERLAADAVATVATQLRGEREPAAAGLPRAVAAKPPRAEPLGPAPIAPPPPSTSLVQPLS